jgi:hypothetical protein
LANATLLSTTTFKELRASSPPLAGAGGWTAPSFGGGRGALRGGNPPPTPASGGYLPPSFPPKGGGLANATLLRKSHIAYRISHTPPSGGLGGA